MLINLRNALMSDKRLPYDAELEFLQSSGTQWINTGITPTISDSTRIVADLSLTSINTSDNNIVLGNYAISPAIRQFAFVDTSAKARIAYVGAASGTVTVAAGTDYLFEAQFAPGNSYLNINGTRSSQNTSTATTLPPQPLALYGSRYLDSVISPSSMRLRSCKIYVNGVLVRDYIPVRKGTVGYLYDRVTRKLFGNAGTGDFVLGPDVVPVEYIESHRTEYIDTGITPSAATECNIDLMFTGTATQQFGTGRSSSSEWAVLLGYYQDKIAFWAGANQSTRLSTYAVNERVMCGFSIPNGTYWLGGNPTEDTNLVAPTTNCQTFALFARKNATNSFSGFCTMRAYSADINGVEGARKYYPVRVGTEGAMMDVLTRRIYRNAGTGAFAYGNDLKYPIPTS